LQCLGPLLTDASPSAVFEDVIFCTVASSMPSLSLWLCNKQAVQTICPRVQVKRSSVFKHFHFVTRIPNAHSAVRLAPEYRQLYTATSQQNAALSVP
jgi:hypothetical protein